VRAGECSLDTHFVKPLYDTYCFAQLPADRSSFPQNATPRFLPLLLGPWQKTLDKVIVLLIDAFGWWFLEQYLGRYPFLSRFLREGVVTKLTSQFRRRPPRT